MEECTFFFFQAEDGIRDKLVTGVQTCALPIYAHHPGHRLCNEVEAGAVSPRSALTESGDAGVDDAGIHAADVGVPDAKPVRDAGTEALDHHIGVTQQVRESITPIRLFEVEDDAPLVPVEREKWCLVLTLHLQSTAPHRP